MVREWWRNSPLERRGTVRLVAVSALAGLVAAAGAVGAAGPWEGGQRKAELDRAAAGAAHADGRHAGPRVPTAPPVLAALGGRATAQEPTRDGLAAVLEPLLKDAALGTDRSAAVYDAATGQQLYGSATDTAYTPASTIKPATAAAALAALEPDHRIDTTVVAGGDGIVLVGGGDPTLTAHPVKAAGPQQPASLQDLAEATARKLKERGTDHTKLSYDASLYSGPPLHVIGPNENIAPVSALMTDEGRLDDSDHGPAGRSADPAGDAARKFAELLGERGVKVDGDVTQGAAGAKAERLAAVSSPPLGALVERALTNSDNDIAEALARQTALASGQPASFEGAAKAVTERLDKLGLQGARIADGSGLDRADQVSAAFLAQLLVRAADPAHPELRPVLTGLPVAGFTGTLSGRYADEETGRGTVRAKTGTLTGVNTLAGTAVSADGRLLTFAFMSSGTNDADAAQRVLDRMATTVAGCGCGG
ncbi:D-alanyl-D-alanine carboxypeptidase/D-alanyl-D-alanine-endopeptidase [Streptomyces sp. NPDC020799]|uniref:D-alanyl-D-alanine carboxypeptidase/D-alanyl-D-alanine endopeptidase n=1 Tax=Streptomyces sp. NPDC020799 TaxID=3365091 RepID=UPI0037BC2AE8